MRKVIAFLLSISCACFAQQAQTKLSGPQSLQGINSKWTQGVGPGYWPTKGSGLTLNLAAGTAFCSGAVVTYAGGTLTMTNTTNYIYLNTSSSCVPAVKTSTFTSSDIPIAVVVASGSVITAITDDRTWFGFGMAGGTVTRGISFTIGDPASTAALTAGSTTTDYLTVPFDCTIQAYNLLVDAGTITVKFWKVATGTAIPTSSNSINTSGVSISSGTAIHSTTLTDFTTTTITANDILAMSVTAAATVKYVNGVLACQ